MKTIWQCKWCGYIKDQDEGIQCGGPDGPNHIFVRKEANTEFEERIKTRLIFPQYAQKKTQVVVTPFPNVTTNDDSSKINEY